MRKPFVLVLLALAVAGAAIAAEYVPIESRLTPRQMHATGLDTLTAPQLAELNAILRAEQAATPAPAPTAVAADPPARQRTLEERERSGSLPGLAEEPIHARLRGAIAHWEPGTVFTLDNGQQWKVLKGEMTLRKPLDSPEIVVAPGLAGRWFLQVDPDLPKARVYRID